MLQTSKAVIFVFALGAAVKTANSLAGASPPATAPTTSPTNGPSAVMRKYLSAIDRQDRVASMAAWDTSDAQTARIIQLHVDMMLAIARLKHAVAERWGAAAPYDLEMAVVSPDECGAITEQITANTADVTVNSKDPKARGPDRYSLVQLKGRWFLSANKADLTPPTHVTVEQELSSARHLVDLIDRVGKEVKNGKCADTQDVLRHISEGMGSP